MLTGDGYDAGLHGCYCDRYYARCCVQYVHHGRYDRCYVRYGHYYGQSDRYDHDDHSGDDYCYDDLDFGDEALQLAL